MKKLLKTRQNIEKAIRWHDQYIGTIPFKLLMRLDEIDRQLVALEYRSKKAA